MCILVTIEYAEKGCRLHEQTTTLRTPIPDHVHSGQQTVQLPASGTACLEPCPDRLALISDHIQLLT